MSDSGRSDRETSEPVENEDCENEVNFKLTKREGTDNKEAEVRRESAG